MTLLGLPDTAVLSLRLSSAVGQPLLPALIARLNAALATCAYVLTAECNGQHLKLVKK